MSRHVLRLLLAIWLGLLPAPASAEVFRWVDELGVTHFTTDRDTIPRRYRGEAQAIGEVPAPAATPRAAAPVPTAAPNATIAPETAVPEVASPEFAPAPTPSVAPSTDWPSAPDAPARPEVPATPEAPAVSAPTVFPGPSPTPAISADDPRAGEVAELEAQIASDREALRQMISTKRWDSAELASDPEIREIAERLPRLQAQLAALQAEPAP